MNDWHADSSVDSNGAYCGTTHCRAGWVVTIAGKPGRDLEGKVGTSHAAMMIYKYSCPEIPVYPVRFFESDSIAMADIIRCAELEKQLHK